MPNSNAATRSTEPAANGSGARAVERPVPLRQAVYDVIVEMIITRTLEPGQHLVEKELAAQLGVSRQPVREALQRLENEGWVDLRPAFGAFVHVPTEDEADQLLTVRTLLETESARLAAQHASQERIDELWQLHHAGVETLENGEQEDLVAANSRLHDCIVRACGNVVLADHLAMVDRRVRWYYAPIARPRGTEAWDEHAEIIKAIAGGEGNRAAELMHDHSERTRAMYARLQREAEQA